MESVSESNVVRIKSVGANFAANNSLSSRYTSYLTLNPLTSSSTWLHSDPTCVVVATADGGQKDPLDVLSSLANRHGFARCSGRLFAMETIVRGVSNFYKHISENIPSNVVIRTHVHPQQFAGEILDHIDEEEHFKKRNIICSPTNFTHVLVAVKMVDEHIGWGLYSLNQYKTVISRPGDGDRSPTFDLNFNRAELKIAEALQLLNKSESEFLFSEPLLAVDVGASPGGWTGHLARVNSHVSVIAIDPGKLSPSVSELNNVSHVASKAECLSVNNGHVLNNVAMQLVGDTWKQQFRLLVCDANMDIRDTLRELVLPLAQYLCSNGIMIVTLKLGRRVGVDGIERKVESANKLLIEAGFNPTLIKVEWLFGNSKNERTIFARKL